MKEKWNRFEWTSIVSIIMWFVGIFAIRTINNIISVPNCVHISMTAVLIAILLLCHFLDSENE